MKTITVLLLATIFTTGVHAQQAPITDKKQDAKEIRADINDVRKDKKERITDLKNGDKNDAKNETKDIKADKKDIRKDAKDLKADGVKHPVRKAKHQIHHHKMKQ